MRKPANTVRHVVVAGLLVVLIPAVVRISRAQQAPSAEPRLDPQTVRTLTRLDYDLRKQKAQVDLKVLQAQLEAKQAEVQILRSQVEMKQAEIQKIDADQRAFDLAPTHAIFTALARSIPMRFPNETPLEDVLKFIKKSTAGPDDTGIPIWVDPVGLTEAEKTMTSPVTLVIEGVPLGTSLRLVLRQLGLTYVVKDGLLRITSEKAAEADDEPL